MNAYVQEVGAVNPFGVGKYSFRQYPDKGFCSIEFLQNTAYLR